MAKTPDEWSGFLLGLRWLLQCHAAARVARVAPGKGLCYNSVRRGVREVDGAALEKRWVAMPRGFESHPLRQQSTLVIRCSCHQLPLADRNQTIGFRP